MHHFCTYFDRNYLLRGLALYRSLSRWNPSARLWVLCLDDETQQILRQLALPAMRLISMAELDGSDPELAQTKASRTRVEYYWTCTPCLPLFLFHREPEIEVLTYVDADLFFYGRTEPIYEELGGNAVLIVEHRFAAAYAQQAQTSGTYNVSLVIFRRDAVGLECLDWWRARCVEWCYHRAEDGRLGDQKYLDDWPRRFRKVTVLQHQGAGLAPWNVANYQLCRRKGQVMVNRDPLIFYHFHAFTLINDYFYCPAHGYPFTWQQLAYLYQPYVRELVRIRRLLGMSEPVLGDRPDQGWQSTWNHWRKGSWGCVFDPRILLRIAWGCLLPRGGSGELLDLSHQT